MNGNGFNLIICVAGGGMVGHGSTVVVKFALTEHDVEFCADEVLKHGPDVVGAAACGLKFTGLAQEIIDIGAE